MMRGTFLICLGVATSLIAASVQAQQETEPQTGTRFRAEPERMKTNPKSNDADNSRRIAKKFGQCLFDRRTKQSIALLTVSDYWAIDYGNLGEAQYLLENRILMEDCLGRVGRGGLGGIGMTISNTIIRGGLVEAAYLEVYNDEDKPIVISDSEPEVLPNRFFVSGPTNYDARAIASLSDCVVFNAPAQAHAIIHTEPASDEERAAVMAIVPALGNCLTAGNELRLDETSIRGFVADGLWARMHYGQEFKDSEGSD